MRFSYGENLKPSSIETNAETEDETEYFQFEREFKDYLELFTTSADEGVMEATLVFDPPVDETEHIKDVEDIGKVIKTDGGVKLGIMSFQMTANEFNIRMV